MRPETEAGLKTHPGCGLGRRPGLRFTILRRPPWRRRRHTKLFDDNGSTGRLARDGRLVAVYAKEPWLSSVYELREWRQSHDVLISYREDSDVRRGGRGPTNPIRLDSFQ